LLALPSTNGKSNDNDKINPTDSQGLTGQPISGVIPAFGRLGLVLGTATAAVPVNLIRLFLSFLKIGAIVFGSGYVLLAFLRTSLPGCSAERIPGR
jgi:hypothetical protein